MPVMPDLTCVSSWAMRSPVSCCQDATDSRNSRHSVSRKAQVKGGVFLQDGLLHRTSKGLVVRSKSELIIADALSQAGVAFEYEKPLTFGNSTRYPDFTVDDEISGRTIYREHVGMLEREDHRKNWEKKLAWYREHGILLADEGIGAHGTLVTTTESSTAGFETSAVQAVIRRYIQG